MICGDADAATAIERVFRGEDDHLNNSGRNQRSGKVTVVVTLTDGDRSPAATC